MSMKINIYLLLFLTTITLASCEKDSVSPNGEPEILEIIYSKTSPVAAAQDIDVKIQKPTPCHYVSEVKESASDKKYTYNIILKDDSGVCATVIEEEVVTITFEPVTSGEYVLNFLINGKLQEIRVITVTD